tara:strand:+ start:5642 stop:6100 length:459 start_codon:yes stop_codon:yes gene_type:complete
MKLEMTTGVEGVEFAQQSVQMTCTDAVTVGDVVELTLASGKYEACSKAETSDITPEIIIGVAAEDTAAGAKGMIILSGTCKVKCDSEVTAGAVLRVSGDHAAQLDLLAVPGANADSFVKCVAISLEAAPAQGALTSVIFDGVQGICCATDAS